MSSDRYERGLDAYASQFGIPREQVPGWFAERVGQRFGEEAIHSAALAWTEQGLSLRDRSLAVIAALIAQGGLEQQLRSHTRWALEHGSSREELEELATLLAIYAGFARASTGLMIIRDELAKLEAALMADKAESTGIPDSYPRVSPALVVQGGARALDFYREVFGARERMRIPGPNGAIAHAEVEIGDSLVMVEDELEPRGTKAPPPDGLAGTPVYLFIYVEDVDAVAQKAVERSATLVRPPQDQVIGVRDAFIIDPFGHGWTVATQIA